MEGSAPVEDQAPPGPTAGPPHHGRPDLVGLPAPWVPAGSGDGTAGDASGTSADDRRVGRVGGVTLREAGLSDRAAARELHRRCSVGTLQARYPGPATDADRYLEHLLDPRFGRSVAAVDPGGRLVALGHLLWDDAESELTVLVEDAWQGRGLGSLLLGRLTGLAVSSGSSAVYAIAQAPHPALVGAMRRLGLPLEFRWEDGTLVVSAPLTGRWPAGPAAGWARASRG